MQETPSDDKTAEEDSIQQPSTKSVEKALSTLNLFLQTNDDTIDDPSVSGSHDEAINGLQYYPMFEKELTIDRRKGSGRKAMKITPQKLRQIKNLFVNNYSILLHTAARKYDASPGYLCTTLKKKTNLRYSKKQTIPKQSDKQTALAKPKCNSLLRNFHHHDFILDDESYFTLSHSTINFTPVMFLSPPANVKFERKILVWIE
ncbi:hypothetical protein ILUMI_25119 [Ignelater luminosus]|uniref:Uncharacterized protein n=1 Tax=Ignelater luminosus TaxID=2038154 RepID=A0A8K0CAK5_IGNLU|nr:hypothetical protein ILUMI_25119 [Ignelater luminosus]